MSPVVRRIAYVPLHYGAEYLAWAVRSVANAVDEVHVLYTPRPSYGHGTALACPDTEERLRAEASRLSSVPIVWHCGSWSTESEHRNTIYSIADARGARQILAFDADEVWAPGAARAALDWAADVPATRIGVPFVHFWKSFRWVCQDHWRPIRVLNVGAPDAEIAHGGAEPLVYHFGYAQSRATMEYKWSCHGHKDELRAGWIERYVGWKPGENDVHPTTNDIWNPRRTLLREDLIVSQTLFDHPYRELETIT